MELLLIVEGIAGLIILYVFFKLGFNVRKIRYELESGKLHDARVNYYVNLTAGKKDEARHYLTYIVFNELVPMADYPIGRTTLYNELKEKHAAKFEAIGYAFPADPFSVAEAPAG